MTTNNDKMGLLTLVGSVPAHLHQSINTLKYESQF